MRPLCATAVVVSENVAEIAVARVAFRSILEASENGAAPETEWIEASRSTNIVQDPDPDDMDILIPFLIYGIPIGSVWAIARYGPVKSRWWRHENPVGFGLFVGALAFLAGFMGPMFIAPESAQGPLLGILYTGPIGTVVGILWGIVRALRRRSAAKVVQ
jgi:hypothetical protein